MCGHRNRYTDYSVRSERNRDVRASDADRERTADDLRRHAGDGRLEPDELEERLDAAFAAKTLADLDALTSDLPRRQHREPRRAAGWGIPVSPLLVVVTALVAVSVAIGHPVFWLFFLLFFAHRWRWAAPRWRRV